MSKSKREVEAIVSAMGVFTSFISLLVRFVKEAGGNVESIYRLATPDGEGTLKRIARLIVDEATTTQKKVFPIWKTIQLGTFENVDELCGAIEGVGGKLSKWARDIIGKLAFTISPEKIMLNLVKISVADLGFEDGATLKEIYERAISLGLELVPAEAGPQLRLQYRDQPAGEWLRMAMEPIEDSGGDPCVFDVNDGVVDLWLRARCVSPGGVWGPDCVFVFAVRK